MTVAGEHPLVEGPEAGTRAFATSRRVRLGDVTPTREIRLDAVARYLQDVAADDVRDAGIEGAAAWVVRRTDLRVVRRPLYNAPVDLVTWCAGTGAAWAERRTTIADDDGPLIESASLWVCLDPRSMRPVPLDEAFFAIYGDAVRSRSVKARLRLPAHPPPDARRCGWALRQADYDVLGHVNNAVAWAAIEQHVSDRDPGHRVVAGVVEYRAPISDGSLLEVAVSDQESGPMVWLSDQAGEAAVVASLRTVATDGPAGGH